MTGLFFSFDSMSMLGMSWSLLFMLLFSIWSMPYLISCRFSNLLMFLLNKVFQEMSVMLKESKILGTELLFISLFFMLFMSNMLGLIIYIFSITAHIMMSFVLGLPLWFAMLLMGFNNPKKVISHLVPLSTPNYLISFMIVIESLSLIIRPITLSVRLAANITAGHLLLSLLAWEGLTLIVCGAQLLMFCLEIMVALIQAYVFTMLLGLYLSESL